MIVRIFKTKYRIKGTFNKNMDKRWVIQCAMPPFYWDWSDVLIYDQAYISLIFNTFAEACDALDHYLDIAAERYAD